MPREIVWCVYDEREVSDSVSFAVARARYLASCHLGHLAPSGPFPFPVPQLLHTKSLVMSIFALKNAFKPSNIRSPTAFLWTKIWPKFAFPFLGQVA